MSSTVSQEDIAQQAESWPSEEHTQFNKEKGKGRQVHTENEDLQNFSKTPDAFSSYPPINDDAEETRRVEENLRRWEIAERQRRKAARESSSVGGVSRRATLLWQGKKSKVPSIGGLGGLGAHTALQSRDNIDILPLRDINTTSPTSSTSRSDSEDGDTVDPFANPPEAHSPFSDAHRAEQPEAENETPVSVYINPPKASHVPPPNSLSLPPPRISPPVIMTPISNPTYGDSNEHLSCGTRWWHEWLCRCGEGPDRGGDNQAGRTNPFE